MVLLWLAGVQGTMSGCHSVSLLREGSMPDEAAAIEASKSAPDPVQGVLVLRDALEQRAMAISRKTSLPLGIGRTMLSMLLVTAAAMAIAGRPGSRSFAVQAIGANAIFAVAAYVLSGEVRAAWIDALARSGGSVEIDSGGGAGAGPPLDLRSASFWYLYCRTGLFVELSVLGAAFAALMSRRTRAFTDAVARAEERLEREDEP